MISRRRMLIILAGVTALPVVGASAAVQVRQWQGIALGAKARIILDHPQADKLIAQAVVEVARLEAIFSLYQPTSQLSVLNRDGRLSNPAFEMVELLSLCSNLHDRTGGAFDPTVQALWSLYARQFSQGRKPSKNQILAAQKSTGWQHVEFSTESITFKKTGMMLTLNGIAQGYIADKITSLFARNGVANVLVNTGEIASLGLAPDGKPWQVKLKDVHSTTIPLSNGAIATSSPLGTAFDGEGKIGHIIDPRTGQPGGKWKEVSVIFTSAAKADGLSTAFCLMERGEIARARGKAKVLLR